MRGEVRSGDGVLIRFEVEGEGPPLVFVHGWSCDRSYFAGQVPAFSNRHRVVCIDLAGHGESGSERQEWTIPAFGEDVVAVSRELGLRRPVLVGHSMGGDVIVEAALRIGDDVAGLVWLDVYAELGEPPPAEQVEAFVGPFRQDFVASTRSLVRRFFPEDADPELVDFVVSDMSAAPPPIAVDALRHSISNPGAILRALPLLPAPLVAINPGYRPTDVEGLAEHGVRTVVMPDVGHFLMMEDPGRFNDLLAQVVAEMP